MRRSLVIVALLLVATSAVGAWFLLGFRVPVVTVAQVRTGPVVDAVYANGTVEPVTWARVEPLQAARIIEIAVREGQQVERGALLARLDPVELLASLRRIEANQRFLEAEVERQRRLAKRGIAATQALERAESELAQVLAQAEAERLRLETFALRAPIAGTVLRRDGELGEIARPGEPMFWVGQASPLWAVVEVDEEDIPLVDPGQSVLIKVDAFPDRAITGMVAEITPKGDPVNKSYRVRLSLPADAPLRIGMTVEANIVVREESGALLVPETAIVSGGEGAYVFVIRDGIAVARPVSVGVVGEMAEVRNGLREGETVIVGPPPALADGTRVRPEG